MDINYRYDGYQTSPVLYKYNFIDIVLCIKVAITLLNLIIFWKLIHMHMTRSFNFYYFKFYQLNC